MDDYLILDLDKTREKFRSNKPTYVRQGEVDSEPLNVQITLDGEPYNLTGCSVYFEALRSDGHKFAENATITSAENGLVSHTVPAGLMLSYGKTELAYFAVYRQDGSIITTETMDIVTLPGICMFTDSDYLPYIEEIIQELESYLDNAEELADTVGDLVAQATTMLSTVNEAVNKSEAAVDSANAATTDAASAASLAQARASEIPLMIENALEGVTDSYLAATSSGIIDKLARNSCTSGMFVNGTWYVKSKDISFDGEALLVKGAEPENGRMLLPTYDCTADDALEVASRAEESALDASREADFNGRIIEELLSTVEALQAALDAVARNAGGYPIFIDGTMYVRNVTYQSGVLSIPEASYSGGMMVLPSM